MASRKLDWQRFRILGLVTRWTTVETWSENDFSCLDLVTWNTLTWYVLPFLDCWLYCLLCMTWSSSGPRCHCQNPLRSTSRSSVWTTTTAVRLKVMQFWLLFTLHAAYIYEKNPTVDYSCTCRGQTIPGLVVRAGPPRPELLESCWNVGLSCNNSCCLQHNTG